MITIESSGSFKNTEDFLTKMSKGNILKTLQQYGQQGVDALSNATPVDSGVTAASWNFTVESSRGSYSITWTNSHVVAGAPVAIMLQYGHGTGTGGWVQGRDYINPAIKPVFDRISEGVWKAVKSA